MFANIFGDAKRKQSSWESMTDDCVSNIGVFMSCLCIHLSVLADPNLMSGLKKAEKDLIILRRSKKHIMKSPQRFNEEKLRYLEIFPIFAYILHFIENNETCSYFH